MNKPWYAYYKDLNAGNEVELWLEEIFGELGAIVLLMVVVHPDCQWVIE